MSNTLTGLNDVILSKAVLDAFVAELTPLTSFSTSFNSEAAQKGDTIKVPRIGTSSAALTKAGSYLLQDSSADVATLTLGQPDYVSAYLDDVQVASSSVLTLQKFGKQKGAQLAKKIFQTIFAQFTAANFGAAIFTGAASIFDSDHIADIHGALDAVNMPNQDRALILSSVYITALLKDTAIKNAAAFGNNNAVLEGTVPRVSGFDIYKSTIIPGNGENLIGIAAHPSGLCVGMRYLKPQDGNTYSAAYPLTDETTGLTIGVREGYDNLSGQKYTIYESVYAAAVGESAGAKRLVSA